MWQLSVTCRLSLLIFLISVGSAAQPNETCPFSQRAAFRLVHTLPSAVRRNYTSLRRLDGIISRASTLVHEYIPPDAANLPIAPQIDISVPSTRRPLLQDEAANIAVPMNQAPLQHLLVQKLKLAFPAPQRALNGHSSHSPSCTRLIPVPIAILEDAHTSQPLLVSTPNYANGHTSNRNANIRVAIPPLTHLFQDNKEALFIPDPPAHRVFVLLRQLKALGSSGALACCGDKETSKISLDARAVELVAAVMQVVVSGCDESGHLVNPELNAELQGGAAAAVLKELTATAKMKGEARRRMWAWSEAREKLRVVKRPLVRMLGAPEMAELRRRWAEQKFVRAEGNMN